jgi:glycosyltransferase involved in cell wall biosynthesis
VHAERYATVPDPAAFTEAWPETQGRRVVLYLGRLNFKKGLDLLAKAFGQLARQRDDVHLLLAGPDDDGYGATVGNGWRTRCAFRRSFAGCCSIAEAHGASLRRRVRPLLGNRARADRGHGVRAARRHLNRVNIWREVVERGGTRRQLRAERCVALAAVLDDLAGRKAIRA